jgi:predicted P-loop ATPase
MTRQQTAIQFVTENYVQFDRIRYDVISNKLQIRKDLGYNWSEMTTQDVNSIVCQCALECDANITSREILTVLKSDLIPSVHPLREYILSLPPYTPEQPDWIDFVAQQVSMTDKASENLWRICFKKWFVAMVASWINDDIVNHQVLVLIGKQGIFKTTWLEHLIPPHLREYQCKLANTQQLNKDERLRIAEFALINLDEIDALNNRELNQLKSVITATDVNERAAYAYTKERRIRLASFCASGNRRDFLTDITGNRRWLPFEVEAIQNPFYTTLPYDLMYAQAYALAKDPMFSYWFNLNEIQTIDSHNQDFREQTNEEQLLMVYFAIPAQNAPNAKFLTTAEISEKLISKGNIKNPLSLSRLGVLLSQQGFLSVRRGSPCKRGWIVYERDSEEINAERKMLAK